MKIDNIEIAPFDNLLVYKPNYTSEIVRKIIAEKKLGGLRIFSILKKDKVENIDFLEQYDFLEKLDVTSLDDYNFNFLKNLGNLKKISINVGGSEEINFQHQKKLEKLIIKWRKKIRGLEELKMLSSLVVIEFKVSDLTSLDDCKDRLLDLTIKTGSILSLNGLQGFMNLHNLSIGNCKKLVSIHGIDRLPKLKTLTIEKCPNIDYNSMVHLPSLESLSLIDCGKIDSVKFIKEFPMLTQLSLLGNTVIGDGDLEPLKHIRTLQHKHYSHYNLKLESPSYDQLVRNNLQKIKNLFK